MQIHTSYVSELLDDQLTFLRAQASDALLLSLPAFLQALGRDPQLAIHLDDMRIEADRLGRTLMQEESDGGNAGGLLSLAWEELGNKLPPGEALTELTRRNNAFLELLRDVDHPFVLPVPSTAREPLGRVSRLLTAVTQLESIANTPILSIETTGHTDMAERNKRVQQRACLLARNDPGVALLRLEAAANATLGEDPIADSRPESDRPRLRTELTEDAFQAAQTASHNARIPGHQSDLDDLATDLQRSAQLLVLELRRRLGTARSRIGVVRRFKARCEWHDRERLRQLADDAAKAKRSAEHALRDEFTRYLFDQGLNPLAEAVLGTSSRADVFDPSIGPAFYVEAKQYSDGAGIESGLRSAFRQALDTVGNLVGTDYMLDEVFIVLFRRGGPRAVLPVEDVMAEGLGWQFVLINIAESSEDASKNRHTPTEYTADQLRAILFEVRDQPTAG